MSNIYELMDTVIQSKDLLLSGQKMIEFADTARQEPNRTAQVKYFNQRLLEWELSGYVSNNLLCENSNDYYVCEESEAVGLYLALALPRKSKSETNSTGYIIASSVREKCSCVVKLL